MDCQKSAEKQECIRCPSHCIHPDRLYGAEKELDAVRADIASSESAMAEMARVAADPNSTQEEISVAIDKALEAAGPANARLMAILSNI